MKNEDDERTSQALKWCKKRNISSKQLSLFDKQFRKEKSKHLSDEEFKEMCKKAKVDPGSLAKTIFTESIEGS